MALIKPNLTKPKVGGDVDVWGDKLNQNVDAQDLYNKQLADDSSTQAQELSRLESEKIDRSELQDFVEVVVDNYVDSNAKPNLDNYVNTVNKPSLDSHTVLKKIEIDDFTEQQKIELDLYEKLKETEITSYTVLSKEGITAHSNSEKELIDSFTEEQKVELDGYEKTKEEELIVFTEEKKQEVVAKADHEIERIKTYGIDGILDEIDFATGDEFEFERPEDSTDPYGDFRRGKEYRLGELVDKMYIEKQEKVDGGLTTRSKNIVGAINELKDITSSDDGESQVKKNKDSIISLQETKADTSYVNQKVADIVNSAPETLDTLKELGDALGNDPNFATTVMNQIGTLSNTKTDRGGYNGTSMDLYNSVVKKSGDTMTGTLIVNSSVSNYGEGVRINNSGGGYSALTLGTTGSGGVEQGQFSLVRTPDEQLHIKSGGYNSNWGISMTKYGDTSFSQAILNNDVLLKKLHGVGYSSAMSDRAALGTWHGDGGYGPASVAGNVFYPAMRVQSVTPSVGYTSRYVLGSSQGGGASYAKFQVCAYGDDATALKHVWEFDMNNGNFATANAYISEVITVGNTLSMGLDKPISFNGAPGSSGVGWQLLERSHNGMFTIDVHSNGAYSSTKFELSPEGNLSLHGSFVADGNIAAFSDIKLKKDLEIIPDALDKIDQLNGYTYTRIESGERQTGVVAQEVQKVLPEAVIENKDEKDEVALGVAYGNMVGLLIEGIKELRAEVKELKAKLAEVK